MGPVGWGVSQFGSWQSAGKGSEDTMGVKVVNAATARFLVAIKAILQINGLTLGNLPSNAGLQGMLMIIDSQGQSGG